MRPSASKNESRSEWSKRSACAKTPAPFLETKPNRDDYAPICQSCPVRDLCLAHALVHDEKGIWAGMTYLQRTKLPVLVKASLNLHLVPRESSVLELLEESKPEPKYPIEVLASLSVKSAKVSLVSVPVDSTVLSDDLDALLLDLQDVSSQLTLLAG